jgi:hypothetical protein
MQGQQFHPKAHQQTVHGFIQTLPRDTAATGFVQQGMRRPAFGPLSRMSDGLVVASVGWYWAICLKSPVSATTVVNCFQGIELIHARIISFRVGAIPLQSGTWKTYWS